ncbi:MAG: hypothetical protein NXH75_04515 [Halobacteriovoraceae bacterium]|nr:hypothetical protein [Halobacteriovoraceae bacterium]
MKFLTPFIIALIFSAEVLGAGACKGLHNYLDMVLNKGMSGSRAVEVQGRISKLTAEGAEVSIETADGFKRVRVANYENGDLLYRLDGSDEVITKTIDEDFSTFFRLADEIETPSPNVVADLGDGARLAEAPAAATRTTDDPATIIPSERALVPVRDQAPTLSGVDVVDDAEIIIDPPALRPTGTDVALRPTGTDVTLRPTGTDLTVSPGTDVAVRPGTDIAVRPGTDLAVVTPIDDVPVIRGTDDPPRITGPPERLLLESSVVARVEPTSVPALRLLTSANEVPEHALPILAKADFPSGSEGKLIELASPTGSVKYRGEIDEIFDHSIRIIKADGTKQNIPFRDLDASDVRFLNEAGELGEPLELATDIQRRWVPTQNSFAGMEGRRVTIVINSSAGRVTHTGVIENVGAGGIKLDSVDNPLRFRRLDGASIEVVDDAGTAIARTTDDAASVVARTTDDAARVPARTTDDAAVVLSRADEAPVVRGGGERVTPIDRVRLRRANTDVPAGRAIIDNDTGEIFEEAAEVLIGNRRPSPDVARIRAVGGENLLDAADEFALSAAEITDSAANARRFVDDVKLPATANDLLGAYQDKFVRIKIGDGDEVVEGVLKRIDGNKAILDDNGTIRRVDLPDFNPDRFVLGNVDELLKADSSVIFVDRAGNAIRRFGAIDGAGKAIPDDAVLAALNKGARFRRVIRNGADHFLEFIHNGKKIRIPRRLLKRANLAIRRNKAIIGDGTFNFVRSGRSLRDGDDDNPTPAGATVSPAGTDDRPETGTTDDPATTTDDPTSTLETPYADGDDGGETDGTTTTGNTDVPADPYAVDPNQSFFGASKQLIKQGWTSLQGLW